MLTRTLNLLAWIGQHPGKTAAYVITAWALASICAAVLLWRMERRDRLEAEKELARPKAPGLKSRRVG